MKTKFSRFGRSSVSVILAVMMLLSTMLVGTMSTVYAFDLKGTYYFDNTDACWDNVYMVFVGNDGKYKEYHQMSASEENFYTYAQNNTWGASGFYFTNSANGSSDGTNKTDTFTSVPDSSRNCFVPTSSSGSGTWMSLEDAKASHKSPVVGSVTLTANPTSVKVGKSVTLTPTVSGANSDSLTYTYKKTFGGTATEVQNADNSLTVTPTVAGTYKYTVTVSADGYSPVTSNEVNFEVTEDAYCNNSDHTHQNLYNVGICATEGTINLNFRYMMSQVEVNLATTGNSDPNHVDLTKAKVELISVYNYGYVKLGDRTVDFTGFSRGDYTLNTVAGEGKENKRWSAIVPQTFSNTKFKITIFKSGDPEQGVDDIYYADITNSSGGWVAGNRYVYNLTVTKTKVQVAATLTDWNTVEANHSIWF